jgi:hypothetical protein
MDNNRRIGTKPIKTDDPHNDLRVIWSADGETILHDGRKKPTTE